MKQKKKKFSIPVVYSHNLVGQKLMDLKINLNVHILENQILKGINDFFSKLENYLSGKDTISNECNYLETLFQEINEIVYNKYLSIEKEIEEILKSIDDINDKIVSFNNEFSFYSDKIFILNSQLLEKEFQINYVESILVKINYLIDNNQINNKSMYDLNLLENENLNKISTSKAEEIVENNLKVIRLEHARAIKKTNSLINEIDNLNNIDQSESNIIIIEDDEKVIPLTTQNKEDKETKLNYEIKNYENLNKNINEEIELYEKQLKGFENDISKYNEDLSNCFQLIVKLETDSITLKRKKARTERLDIIKNN